MSAFTRSFDNGFGLRTTMLHSLRIGGCMEILGNLDSRHMRPVPIGEVVHDLIDRLGTCPVGLPELASATAAFTAREQGFSVAALAVAGPPNPASNAAIDGIAL